MPMPLRNVLALLLVFGLTLIGPSWGRAGDQYTGAREKLVQLLAEEVSATRYYLDKAELDPLVVAALQKVPRHEFVAERLRDVAYENRPLPIGYGQTISQPYIVAIMTDLLSLAKGDKVLEIGTGSGYQAAVLAEMAAEVYSVEIIEELGKSARERLKRLGYDNVQVRLGDGYYGWQEKGPFDAIMVTAAAGHIPPPLISQLKPGGKMMIPVGGSFMVQHLVILAKDADGAITTRQLLPVRFVPLTGQH